jgi:Domain of unknown function (DUF4382)
VRRANSFARTIAPAQSVFLAVLLCSLGLIGCDNSCVVFVSNPGGGTISGSLNSCPLNQLNGNVRVQLATLVAPSTGDEPIRVEHIFVTIRGIEANPSATAADDSPGWQELAPKLLPQPMQFDLLANNRDSSASVAFEDAAVRADAYRQIRLRLTPNQPYGTNSILQANSCGSVGFNCLVSSDGAVRPLALQSGSSQIHISSEQIAEGFVRVLPETTTTLTIEFNPRLSVFFHTDGLSQEPSDSAVQLVPSFIVESQTANESATGGP